ncbi:MAG: glycosyltransferase family 1 protein [Acidobacteria bacterium]|jgi:glycosyltransferase involved in cell wall biosynthesis|nr:MAG: glycosyltransferase family 1 protein [Acidobacteriota bacterium]
MSIEILINATFMHDNPTGLGVYTREILEALLERDREVKAVVPKSYRNSEYKNRFILAPDTITPGKGFKNNLLRIMWLQLGLLKAAAGKSALIYSTVPEGLVYTTKNIKQIITVHDLLPFRYPEEYPRIRYYMRFLLPRIIRSSTKVVCISENTKKDLVEYYGIEEHDKLVVIYPGANLKRFSTYEKEEKGATDSEEYVLYVGALRRYKNVLKLIKAIERLKDFNLKLLIVGDNRGGYYKELTDYVRNRGIEHLVSFLGYVDDKTLTNLYRGAKAFVFPSLYEGFGLPPLEAMACGCPVIASNTSSIPEACGDAAIYFDPEDIEDMAKKIHLVLYNQNLRSLLIKKGIERAKKFTWEKTAERILNLFYSMIK